MALEKLVVFLCCLIFARGKRKTFDVLSVWCHLTLLVRACGVFSVCGLVRCGRFGGEDILEYHGSTVYRCTA